MKFRLRRRGAGRGIPRDTGISGLRTELRIRRGASREDALLAFREAVNRPNTMFSTDPWLLPKLELLGQLLHDPITEEEAWALLDVLYERHWMADLLEWLQREPIFWPNFFVQRKFLKRVAEQKEREASRKAQEKWEQDKKSGVFEAERLATMEAELASAKEEPARSQAVPALWNGAPKPGVVLVLQPRINLGKSLRLCRVEDPLQVVS